MTHFEAQSFDIPELVGISKTTIEEHLKLYAGYVKHANLILEQMGKSPSTALGADDAYASSEMMRRFGFEFDGMRNHEYYFHALEGGAQELSDGTLKNAIEKNFGSFDAWIEQFKTLAKTRGVGWAILYYDPQTDQLLNAWIDEQHFGHLTGLSPILALDMWEHSFVADYQPSGKGKYIDDFFTNLNWNVIEENFSKTQK